jgi:hypothetical protein
LNADNLRLPGAHSPRTDERCLTYCTQTAAGRTAGRTPICRSICIRHVFIHELTKLSQGRPASSILAKDGEKDQEELDAIPLPTEGQRPGEFFAPLWPPFLTPLRSDPANPDKRRAGPTSAADALRAAGKAVDTDDLLADDDEPASNDKPASPPKTWAPGTYVWVTRSKWHALDHMNMMMFSLRAQAGWDNYRARMRKEAEARLEALNAPVSTTSRRAAKETKEQEIEDVYEDVTIPKLDEFHPSMSGRSRKGVSIGVPVYPDVSYVHIVLPMGASLTFLQWAILTGSFTATGTVNTASNGATTLTGRPTSGSHVTSMAGRCVRRPGEAMLRQGIRR